MKKIFSRLNHNAIGASKALGLLSLILILSSNTLFSAMEGEVDVTGQAVKKYGYSSKFDEYRTVPEGVYLEKLSVKTETEKSKCYLNVKGSKLGLDDQGFSLRGGKWGVAQVDLKYDQIPHNYSNTARSLFVYNGENYLNFPDQLQTDLQTSTNNAPAAFSKMPYVPLKIRRDAFSGALKLTPSDAVNIRISGGEEDRNGTMQGSAYSSLTEIPLPVKNHTRDFSASAEIHQEMFNAMLIYNGSIFSNDIKEVIYDNPFRAFPPSPTTGSGSSTSDKFGIGQPPDNQAHSFTLAGGANLPFWDSRLNTSISYGWMSQNDDFLPATVNQNLIDSAKSLGVSLDPNASSLNGKINTLSINTSWNLRPVKPLALEAKIRYYKLDNQTPQLEVKDRVVLDLIISTSYPKVGFNNNRDRISMPNGYSKLDLGTGLSYQLLSSLGLNLGYDFERMNRDRRETDTTIEHTLKASLNYLPKSWIDFRPSYLHSNRYYNSYDAEKVAEESFPLGEGVTNVVGQSPLLRKYDQADRVRDMVGIKTTIYPLDSLTLAAEYSYMMDKYGENQIGKSGEMNHAIGVDLTYEPVDVLTLFGSYSVEKNVTDIHQRYRESGTALPARLPLDFQDNDWFATAEDITDTFGIGANGVIVKKKLDLDAEYNLTRSRGQLRANNPGTIVTNPNMGQGNATTQASNAVASDFSETNNQYHKISTSLKWYLLENLTARLKYTYERYMETDFAVDPLQPWQPTYGPVVGPENFSSYVFLGATQGNYDAHIISLSLTYKF